MLGELSSGHAGCTEIKEEMKSSRAMQTQTETETQREEKVFDTKICRSIQK